MKKTNTTQEYINLLSKYEPSLADYNNKIIDVAVKLKNGAYFEVEKQSITKDFCFGFGYCGISSQEEESYASEQAENASTSVKAFLSENFKKIDKSINEFKDVNNKVVGVYQYGNSNIDKITVHIYEDEWEFKRWCRTEKMYIIDEEERAEIIKALEEEKEAFTKRLNTYLKRFGLSKLSVWTYLVD